MNLNLVNLGWNETFQLSFNTLNSGNLIPARVIRENRGQYIVHTGEEERIARLPGVALQSTVESTDFPTVGDWLAAEQIPNVEDLIIRSILPRKSLFERKMAGEESRNQRVAANFDYLFIVCGLDDDFNLQRIQRYLSLAWNSQAQPVIILNKADLAEDLNRILSEVRAIAKDVQIYPVIATDPTTMGCLKHFLAKGNTVAMLGSSGVGKSSLANALLGEDRMKTQAVRGTDSLGRHTTTWRELILLPDGAMLIDIPGMRELGLTGEEAGVKRTFHDIQLLAKKCRYRNCQHRGEPECAVEEAINNGDLNPERLHQYLKFRRENSKTKARQVNRKKQESSEKKKYREKDQFFKEVMIQHKKNAKAKRKFNKNWDF